MKIRLNKLREYNPGISKQIKAKKKNTLTAVQKLFNNRQEVIETSKTGIFPYAHGFQIEKASEEESEKGSEEESKEESEKESKEELDEQHDFKTFFEYIENESKGIGYELFKNYFNYTVPSVLAKELYEIKNKTKNSDLVNKIKDELSDFKNEIKKVSENEIRIEKPHKIINIVEKILMFNEKEQNQQGQGLNILTF